MFEGAKRDRSLGATLSITRSAALIEVAPKYDDCRSTARDRAFTSSASAGIGSRFLLSSSHSVSWLGICSRFARLLSSSEPEFKGDRYSCDIGEVLEPEGDVFESALRGDRSMSATSSFLDNGNNCCTSRSG